MEWLEYICSEAARLKASCPEISDSSFVVPILSLPVVSVSVLSNIKWVVPGSASMAFSPMTKTMTMTRRKPLSALARATGVANASTQAANN
ncbi:MAG: hypothetical protein ACJASY_000022 [Halioglobus sp.]|jgi:hypothetical protein